MTLKLKVIQETYQ